MHSHAPDSLISLSDVGLRRDGCTILEHVSLTVNRGDFVAITGPNGGGKTTLLRIILRLIKPTCGIVSYPRQGLTIGYLPQKNQIDSHFPITVRQVVASGLIGVKGRGLAVDTVLEMVGLEDYAASPIGVLSGGQLQRTLLGRAIIAEPELIVMDEPLSYIDRHFEQRLTGMFADLRGRTTMIMVSHQLEAISALANRHFMVDRVLTECHAQSHSAPDYGCHEK